MERRVVARPATARASVLAQVVGISLLCVTLLFMTRGGPGQDAMSPRRQLSTRPVNAPVRSSAAQPQQGLAVALDPPPDHPTNAKPRASNDLLHKDGALQHLSPVKTAPRADGGGNPVGMARPLPDLPPPEYVAFIGVFTSIAPQYLKRRWVLRQSWFPPTKKALEEFESTHHLKMRFVVGKDKEGGVPEAVRKEEEEFGGHLHLDVYEEYDNLKLKMLKFFRDTMSVFRAQYYLKVDDDIWFRPERVPLAVHQWMGHNADFVGCFRKGTTMFDQPNNRYYEPQRFLFHQEKYFLYTSGPAMGISYHASALLASLPEGGLRFYGAGDASVGGWMLGLNVSHHEDHRLCHRRCEHNTLAFYDNCNGMCKPYEALPKAKEEQCGTEPAIPRGYSYLPEAKTYPFDPSRERCARIYKDWLDQSECRKALQKGRRHSAR